MSIPLIPFISRLTVAVEWFFMFIWKSSLEKDTLDHFAVVPVYLHSQGPSLLLLCASLANSESGKAPQFPAPGLVGVKIEAISNNCWMCCVCTSVVAFWIEFRARARQAPPPLFIFVVTPLKEMRLWHKSSLTWLQHRRLVRYCRDNSIATMALDNNCNVTTGDHLLIGFCSVNSESVVCSEFG